MSEEAQNMQTLYVSFTVKTGKHTVQVASTRVICRITMNEKYHYDCCSDTLAVMRDRSRECHRF